MERPPTLANELGVAAFFASPSPTAITRPSDGLIVEANDAFLRVVDRPREEVIGSTTTALGIWPDPRVRDAFIALLLEDGSVDDYPADVCFAEGVRHVRLSARTVTVDGERLILTVAIDETDSRRAMEELRTAEAKYRTLVESIRAVVFVDDADGSWRTRYISPQIEAFLGVPPEQYMADPELWERLLHPEDRERAVAEYAAGARSRLPFSIEYRIQGASGGWLSIRDEVAPVFDDDGELLFLQGVSLDLSDLEEARDQVARSEALLRATLESTADGILVASTDGRVLHANERFAAMWRIPDDMLARGDDAEIVRFVAGQLEDPEGFLTSVRSLNEGRRDGFDRLAFRDGRIFERTSRPLVRGDELLGRVWSFNDVTERWRAEEELRDREERYRQMFEGNRAVQWMFDPETLRIFDANPAAADFYGYPVEDLRGMRIVDVNELPEERVRTAVAEVLDGRVKSFVFPHRLATGEVREVQVHPSPVRAGGRTMIYSVLHDVTEQRRAEAQLRAAEARYRTLVEQIPAVLYIDRPDDSLETLYVSPRVKEILGVSPERWIAETDTWHQHIHPDDRARVLKSYLGSIRRGLPTSIEYRWVRPDGRELWVLDRTEIIRDQDGAPIALQGVIFDLTEQRQAEEELRRSVELLAKVDGERRTLLARLVVAQEEERAHIAGDIHDDSIQKMTAVGLRIEALSSRMQGDEERRLLQELSRTVRATISRLRHLMFELHPPALDRDGLSAAIAQELEELRTESGIGTRLDNRLVSEPPGVTRAIAYRIVQEALVNAAKHAQATGVEVALETRGDDLFVRVRDDGRGFRYERAPAAPGHMGLTAMRERAELAGGWFRVESSEGAGTAVEFSLPLRADARAGAR